MVELIELVVTKVFLFMAIGAVLVKTKILPENVLAWLLKYVVVTVLFPMLILYKSFSTDASGGLIGIAICFAIGVLFIWGQFFFASLAARIRRPIVHKNSFVLGGSFHNYGFVILPLVLALNEQGLMQEQALPLTFAFVLGCDGMFWSLGIYILKRGGDVKIPLTQIISPPFIALFLSTVIAQLELVPPEQYWSWLEAPSQIAIPTALILIGGVFALATPGLKQFMRLLHQLRTDYIWLFGLQHLFYPVFWVGFVIGLEAIMIEIGGGQLPDYFSNDILVITKLEAIMPASVGITLLGKLYGGREDFLASFSVASVTIGVLLIPFLMKVVL